MKNPFAEWIAEYINASKNPIARWMAKHKVGTFVWGSISLIFVVGFILYAESPLTTSNRIVRFVPEKGITRVSFSKSSIPSESLRTVAKSEKVLFAYFYLKTNVASAQCSYQWHANARPIRSDRITCENGFNIIPLYDGIFLLIDGNHVVRIFDADAKTILTEIHFRVIDP
jgi:hypothetical protein